MKKLSLLFLAICLLLSFVSCGRIPITQTDNSQRNIDQEKNITVVNDNNEVEEKEKTTENIEEDTLIKDNEPETYVEEDVKGDFRKAQWGMTAKEVIETENSEQYDEIDDKIIFYDQEVMGFDCIILYKFYQGQLYEGSYIFTQTYSNEIMYINNFDDIKSALVDLYGQPIEDETVWLDDLWKDDIGMAILVGDLMKYARWEKENNTLITLLLAGGNYTISFGVTYKDESVAKDIKPDTSGL